MADFLEEKRREIQQRLKELKPLVDEYQRLEAAERALAGVGNGGGARHGARRGARARASASTAAGRRGRPKGSGTRAAQALELVRAQPGITIPELAEAMGIKQNYLYRVMPTLAERGPDREVRARLARQDKETLVTVNGARRPPAGRHLTPAPASPPRRAPRAAPHGPVDPRAGELRDVEALRRSPTRRPRSGTGNEEMIPSSTP